MVALENQTQTALALLKELVEINSGSRHVAGVTQIQKVIARELQAMGFVIQLKVHPTEPSTFGPFLIATLSTQSTSAGPYLDILTHADTVFEIDSGFDQFTLKVKEGIATGPGVIDDKGGIVVALEGLRAYLKTTPNPVKLRFICTPSEELGSPGFLNLFQILGQESWMVLGFEPSLEDGSIIESRRGNRWYQIHVQGQEAHAGRNPEQGINAAHELAHKIVKLAALNDPLKKITVSTGALNGGSKFNVVCGEASAKVDVRFGDFESRDRVHQRVEEIIRCNHVLHQSGHSSGQSSGGNPDQELPVSSYVIADDCPPMIQDSFSRQYVEKYLELIAEVENRRVGSIQSGGAADTNYMSRPGLITIDGLGPTGGLLHTKGEWLKISSLLTRAESFRRFLVDVEKTLSNVYCRA